MLPTESLVKGIQIAKCIYNYCIYVVDMHTGHQCKVNELEYGKLLLETCSLVNSESQIHRYLAYMYAGALHYTICFRVTWIQIEGSVVVFDSSEVLESSLTFY